uniref:Uncharacterized protein n=1 Tax=Oryzias latipes TaxID=8090 RepID=A0A3B3I3J6_ORYLA
VNLSCSQSINISVALYHLTTNPKKVLHSFSILKALLTTVPLWCVVSARTCPPNQFSCASGRCIPASWTCDLDDDCGDRSDEPAFCVDQKPLPSVYKCKYLFSVSRMRGNECVCLPDNDCGDNSDEAGCSHSCSSAQFKCNSGRCIPDYWTCDGDNDCGDYSDETHANCTNRGRCDAETYEFQCLMDGLCIPLRWRCDGDTDCMDMSDEKECEGVTHMCDPAVKFGCKDSGEEIRKCVRSWVCDGDSDCEDNSDEENCEALVCKLSHHVCANDSTICLPAEKLCDGTDDCPDGSDEKLCGEKQQFSHCASEQGSHNELGVGCCVCLCTVCSYFSQADAIVQS